MPCFFRLDVDLWAQRQRIVYHILVVKKHQGNIGKGLERAHSPFGTYLGKSSDVADGILFSSNCGHD